MAVLTFCKWSPCGNTTLLFPAHGLDAARQARLAAEALDPACLGGEQAGFADRRARSLRMAGGSSVSMPQELSARSWPLRKAARMERRISGAISPYRDGRRGWASARADVARNGMCPPA